MEFKDRIWYARSAVQTNIVRPKQTGMCQMFSIGMLFDDFFTLNHVSWIFVICITICNLFVTSISLDKEKF
jgi:hypothetical protein